MRSPLLSIVIAAGCAAPQEDVSGGGTLTLTFPDDGPLTGTHSIPGATQDCLDTHGRVFCTDPHLELGTDTKDGTEPDYWAVEAWIPLVASDYDLDCFGGADLELSVFLHQSVGVDNHDFWFKLEDPVLAADDPNADQGGPISPAFRGDLKIEGALDPTASGSVGGTLLLTGERGCEVEAGSTLETTLTWDFDPTVTAGPGLLSLK